MGTPPLHLRASKINKEIRCMDKTEGVSRSLRGPGSSQYSRDSLAGRNRFELRGRRALFARDTFLGNVLVLRWANFSNLQPRDARLPASPLMSRLVVATLSNPTSSHRPKVDSGLHSRRFPDCVSNKAALCNFSSFLLATAGSCLAVEHLRGSGGD